MRAMARKKVRSDLSECTIKPHVVIHWSGVDYYRIEPRALFHLLVFV